MEHALAAVDHRLGAAELGLHPATSGEPPLRNDDRLAQRVVDRVLDEPPAHVVDERAVLERVDAAGGNLADRRRIRGAEGGDGDDGGDDEIDGDHVDGALGNAGKLAEQAAAVRQDHRLGHAEPADPPGSRFRPRRLDDRRPHDAHGHVAAGVDEGLFAERLGEGVGVRPPDTRCPGPPGVDELIAYPAFAQLLRLGSERRCSGSAELSARLGTELRQSIRQPARRLAVATHPPRRGDFVAPAQPEVERAFGTPAPRARCRGGCRRRSTSKRRRGAASPRARRAAWRCESARAG